MSVNRNYDPHRKWEPRPPPKSGEGGRTSAMIASLAAEGYETVSAPFGHALVAEARRNDRIVGLTADLAKYTDLHVFAEAFPERFYQMGMAEQVMISAAAGLAREGFMPLPPPMRSSPRAGPMTSSPWRLRRSICPSRSSAPCRA